jgi:hypothetical protein
MPRIVTLLACVLFVLSGLGACTDAGSGADQAFRVRGAQFLAGRLPGVEAFPDEPLEPLITALDTANLSVFQGQGNKAFSGRAQASASSVAVGLVGVGSGYWVLPTGAPDTATGELSYAFNADFDLSLTPGRYVLRIVAIDEQGSGGDQLDLDVCVTGRCRTTVARAVRTRRRRRP